MLKYRVFCPSSGYCWLVKDIDLALINAGLKNMIPEIVAHRMAEKLNTKPCNILELAISEISAAIEAGDIPGTDSYLLYIFRKELKKCQA